MVYCTQQRALSGQAITDSEWAWRGPKMDERTVSRPPSWEIDTVTVILPFAFGLPKALTNLSPATINRDEVNEHRATEASREGKSLRWTGTQGKRKVAHTGRQLGEFRDRTIFVADLFDQLGDVRDDLEHGTTGLWGCFNEEADRKRVIIRTGQIFPGTRGILSPETLSNFLKELNTGYGDFKGDFFTICQIWINPLRNGPNPEDVTKRFVANVSVAAAMTGFNPLKPKELCFFKDGNTLKVGSREFGLRYPHD